MTAKLYQLPVPPKKINWGFWYAGASLALAAGSIAVAAKFGMNWVEAEHKIKRTQDEVYGLQSDIARYRDDICRRDGQAAVKEESLRHFHPESKPYLSGQWRFYAGPVHQSNPDYRRSGYSYVRCYAQSLDDQKITFPYTAKRPDESVTVNNRPSMAHDLVQYNLIAPR